jgi:quinoprotein glucose dehydrogenase
MRCPEVQPAKVEFQAVWRKLFAQAPVVLLLILLAAIGVTFPILMAGQRVPSLHNTTEWPSYGNDKGGMRYAPLTQITPANVSRLQIAWTFRSGDRSDGTGRDNPSASAFEATPILVKRRLVFCTPFNRVIALDPLTGTQLWAFDPKIDLKPKYENQLACRGVSSWTDRNKREGEVCQTRIFTGTNDGRLFAIDADTGAVCTDFANKGQYDLKADVGLLRWGGEYQVTSPPAIIGDRVVVGSAIADNQRIDAPSGVVRAFDARSGRLLWGQDLAPPNYNGPRSVQGGYALGTPNVWSIMSVDEEMGLIYLPTGNPAPDFFRGATRADMDYYGSSVVALRADTGAVVWRFQTVHHDLWDYDVPAQPALFTLRKEDGTAIPALAQATKTGHLFILDRRTGEPVFGVTEKPVPQAGAPGETLSPTQPVPNRPPPLAAQRLRPEETDDKIIGRRCRDILKGMRSEGIFTPPSFRGTVMFPGSGGGLNWSGVGIDPERQILITNSTNVAWALRLFPGERFRDEFKANPKGEVRPQDGTPFGMSRSFFTEKFALIFDVPCNPSPWGHLNAINLRNGEILWRKPFGRAFGIDGVPSLGGAILTSTGLAFIAGTIRDDNIRAFDVMTGEEKWKRQLPSGGQATPMTYEVEVGDGKRRQFVVIAAGGNPRGTSSAGDYLVAFSLQQ